MKNVPLQITVIAKGEIITHLSTFSSDYLDNLVKSAINKSALVYHLGDLLTKKSDKQTTEWGQLAEEALARYVANTNTYQLIRTLGFQTLVITVFKANGPSGKGYQARVAGTVSEKYDDIEVIIEGRPAANKINNVVLFFFQGSINLYVDPYTKESTFHQLKAEAQSLYGKIQYEIKPGNTAERNERNDNPEDHAESLECEFDDFGDE